MSSYRSRVRLSLTQPEADALLAMIGSAEAGDMDELFNRDGRAVNAAERAARKTRAAVRAAEERDRAKGRTSGE